MIFIIILIIYDIAVSFRIPEYAEIVKRHKSPFKPLIIFEIANNHMGSVEHGLRIIDTFGEYRQHYPFNFAFKFHRISITLGSIGYLGDHRRIQHGPRYAVPRV